MLDGHGLLAAAHYAEGSTRLVSDVPSLSIHEAFEGATRGKSQEFFEDPLKDNGEGIIKRMLRELVAATPINPVAGNSNSLMGQMAASTSDVGTDFAADPRWRPLLDAPLTHLDIEAARPIRARCARACGCR